LPQLELQISALRLVVTAPAALGQHAAGEQQQPAPRPLLHAISNLPVLPLLAAASELQDQWPIMWAEAAAASGREAEVQQAGRDSAAPLEAAAAAAAAGGLSPDVLVRGATFNCHMSPLLADLSLLLRPHSAAAHGGFSAAARCQLASSLLQYCKEAGLLALAGVIEHVMAGCEVVSGPAAVAGVEAAATTAEQEDSAMGGAPEGASSASSVGGAEVLSATSSASGAVPQGLTSAAAPQQAMASSGTAGAAAPEAAAAAATEATAGHVGAGSVGRQAAAAVAGPVPEGVAGAAAGATGAQPAPTQIAVLPNTIQKHSNGALSNSSTGTGASGSGSSLGSPVQSGPDLRLKEWRRGFSVFVARESYVIRLVLVLVEMILERWGCTGGVYQLRG